MDVIAAIILSLHHHDASGIYNISLGQPVTHLHLAKTINDAFDNSGNLVTLPDRPQDKGKQWMSCERAWNELGWRSRWNLSEMFIDLAGKLAMQGM
jgi:nucleoside-diphosphate-sugar epimerase